MLARSAAFLWLLFSPCFCVASMATVRLGRGALGGAGVVSEVPAARVQVTEIEPVIDGAIDDKAWRKATQIELLRTLDGKRAAPQPTQVFLLRSRSFFFVAFLCKEPFMEKLRAFHTARDDPLWEDDSVEIYIGRENSYFLLIINSTGAVYDAKVKDRNWNCDAKAAVRRGKNFWCLEIAIPLEALGPELRDSMVWRANFLRNRYVTGRNEITAWSPTYCDDAHVPERFGRIIFAKPPNLQKACPGSLQSPQKACPGSLQKITS